jgi:hypothetical protein
VSLRMRLGRAYSHALCLPWLHRYVKSPDNAVSKPDSSPLHIFLHKLPLNSSYISILTHTIVHDIQVDQCELVEEYSQRLFILPK